MSSKLATRRKRRSSCFLSNESLSGVAEYSRGDVDKKRMKVTPVASAATAELFVTRLTKEIVKPFCFAPEPSKESTTSHYLSGRKLEKKASVAPTSYVEDAAKQKASLLRKIARSRMLIGINQCTRALISDSAHSDISLIVLAKDIYPPTMLAHVPLLSQEKNIPLLLLPGQASFDLGCALGIKKASIIVFRKNLGETSTHHADMDSFIGYASSLVDIAS